MGLALLIVIPTLREGETLAACLRNLQPLREKGVQVIVADAGSADMTWALACAGADQVITAPRGRASQMNAGAAWKPAAWPGAVKFSVGASGVDGHRPVDTEVLLFLHADTRLPPDADALIFQACEAGHVWGRFDVAFAPPGRLAWITTLMNWRSAVLHFPLS